MFGAHHFDDGSAVLLEVLRQVFHELRGEFVSKLQTLQQSVAEIPAPSALATGPAPSSSSKGTSLVAGQPGG